MAKKARGAVYRVVDVAGVGKQSWEDAGRRGRDRGLIAA